MDGIVSYKRERNSWRGLKKRSYEPTGYAQLFGKYNTTPEDKLKLDLLHIKQRSLAMDLKLILYTIKIIFIAESTEGVEEGKITASEK